MERFEALRGYYEHYDEDARLTSRHGSVEFLTTVSYIEKYLKPGMRILEIGAGSGRYSHYFARKGYTVDAVELMECNISVFRDRTEDGENVSIIQGDAVDLRGISSGQYDITLLLGPMYHLFAESERLSAISEALRVTKPGGIVFAAYCLNEATVIQFGFQKGMIRQEPYRHLIDPVTFRCAAEPSEVFALWRREDIDALMAHFPVERLHYVGTDMATNYMRACVDEMDDEMFALYLRYHFSICERADCVGTSHHVLDIFRKS
ncbi:MAG: class I SAM-dependent methyltransferase [Eubacteriales bacterium]